MKKHNLLKYLVLGMLILFAACNQGKKIVTPESVGLSGDTLNLAAQKIQEFIDSGKWAGITTLIMKNGSVVYRERFGYNDLENQEPIEENTIFRIFSMTKPITTVALMTLYDEGKFKLDDKVADYIPEFKETLVYQPGEDGPALEPQANEMSIRHLLTHTSGITYGWDPNSYVDSLYGVAKVGNWESTTIGEKVKVLAGLPLKHQPGTKWEYSLSIDVAGYLVEVLSGLPLDEYFRTRIFDPLKMDDTGFFVPEEKHDRLAGLYYRDENGFLQSAGEWGDRFKKPATVFSGGGGLVSTMDDFLTFCKMLLNGGELDGKRILQESTVKMIMSDQLPSGVKYGEDSGYGLGGQVNLLTSEYAWGGAASTNFWINPANDMVVICYAQLMPSDHSYAYVFKDFVNRALLNE
jgi:CubicO group peptidase (beta-lactamase class C family)